MSGSAVSGRALLHLLRSTCERAATISFSTRVSVSRWSSAGEPAAGQRLSPSMHRAFSICRPQAAAAKLKRKELNADVPVSRPAVATAPRPALKLRPYQEDCIAECLEALRQGYKRIGISSPTGSGKTTIFTSLIEQLPDIGDSGKKVLILVSSIELALQAARTVASFYPRLLVEIEQGAKFKASGVADVTIATVQTLSRQSSGEERLSKFDPANFKAVIVDEAHHAAAQSYIRVLSHFNGAVGGGDGHAETAPEPEHQVPILGFSATFSRHDGLALGSVFQRIVYHKDFLEMIGEGWLSPLRFTVIRAKLDLHKVKRMSASGGGDFQTASLAQHVNTPEINKLIVRTWLDRCWRPDEAVRKPRRSTLVFCVNIDHVNSLADEFRAAGIDARTLTGETPTKDRSDVLRRFRAMEFPVLVNCAILTEGADVPAIDCVLLARPTRSQNLFSQMIGRGARLSPETGKTDALILDLVGNVEQGNGVVCTPSLFGLSVDEDIDDVPLDELKQRASEPEVAPGAADGDEDSLVSVSRLSYIDYDNPHELQAMLMRPGRAPVLERMSRNAWIDCGHDIFVLDIPKHGYIKVERSTDAEKAEGGGPWKSVHTPANFDADQTAALSGLPGMSRGWPFAKRGGASPYRRPRHVLYANDLETAIRGSDTYATTRVLRSSPFSSLLDRRATWRSKPASESQRALVERRLGFNKVPQRTGDGTNVGSMAAPMPKLENLTRGVASLILTRLNHGAKSRWEEEAKRQNRIFEKEAAEAARRARETVRVGDLPVR